MSVLLSPGSLRESSVVTSAAVSFSSLGLLPELLNALKAKGYESPTPVQAAVIPLILQGGDVLAGAQTGTGKTAGFTLPLLQRLMTVSKGQPSRSPHPRRQRGFRPVRTLILTPTRELAAQVEESVQTYGKFLPLVSTAIFGGVSMGPQLRALERGVDILVATPGRLMDHVSQNTIDLGKVEILVLDEADRMLDMGFIRDIRKILALLPAERQNLLFSATFSDEIKALAGEFLNEPEHVEIGQRNTESALVTQSVYLTNRDNKRSLLTDLLIKKDITQALIFTRTKHGADRLAGQLELDGITTAAIHSNRSQQQRMRALADFKAGAIRILVATDIAARGLDIIQLPHVINYDLPNIPEDYVHRIGRTGRAGSPGEAISLVSPDEQKHLQAIERLLRKKLDRQHLEGKSAPAVVVAEQSVREERPYRPTPLRSRQKVEVQWGEKPRAHKGISATPRHKRKSNPSAPLTPAPFERFRRKDQPSRNQG